MSCNKIKKIAALNDAFRESMTGGRVYVTPGVNALNAKTRSALYSKVRQYDAFTKDNDPHNEHDFGLILHEGEKYFWKIDYYDLSVRMLSEDPSNPEITIRTLTIMRADEY